MSKFFATILVTLFTFLTFASPSLGHGLGQTLRKESEKWIVELEYEALELTEDEPVEYAFRLIDKESNKAAEFDSVDVRVVDRNKNSGVFSANLSPKAAFSLGPRVYLKLEEGDYTFGTTFNQGEEELAKESFDLTVLKGESKKDLAAVSLGFLGGLVIGGVLMALSIKRAKTK